MITLAATSYIQWSQCLPWQERHIFMRSDDISRWKAASSYWFWRLCSFHSL